MIVRIANFFSGCLITLPNLLATLYVREKLQGNYMVLININFLLSLPWSLKFIYGFLADKFPFRSQKHIEYMKVIPVFGLYLYLLSLLTTFSPFYYGLFVLLCSICNASFQSVLFAHTAYVSQLPGFDERVLRRGLYFNNLGRLSSSVFYIAASFFLRNHHDWLIRVVYSVCFSAYAVLLFFCNWESAFDPSYGYTEAGGREAPSVFEAVGIFLANKRVRLLVLYTVVFNVIPQFDTYVVYLLTDRVDQGGLGFSYSFLTTLSMTGYLGGILAGYLLSRTTKKQRQVSGMISTVLQDEHDFSCSKTEIPDGQKTGYFVAAHGIAVVSLLAYALMFAWFPRNGTAVVGVVALVQLLSGAGGMLTVTSAQEIVVEGSPKGYEGTFTTLYFSFYNLSALISTYSGVTVYKAAGLITEAGYRKLVLPHLFGALIGLVLLPLAFKLK